MDKKELIINKLENIIDRIKSNNNINFDNLTEQILNVAIDSNQSFDDFIKKNMYNQILEYEENILEKNINFYDLPYYLLEGNFQDRVFTPWNSTCQNNLFLWQKNCSDLYDEAYENLENKGYKYDSFNEYHLTELFLIERAYESLITNFINRTDYEYDDKITKNILNKFNEFINENFQEKNLWKQKISNEIER